MICCAIQSPLDMHVEDGCASIYFNKKVSSGINLLKEWCKTNTDPAHFNLPGNHINFCSHAKVASRVL